MCNRPLCAHYPTRLPINLPLIIAIPQITPNAICDSQATSRLCFANKSEISFSLEQRTQARSYPLMADLVLFDRQGRVDTGEGQPEPKANAFLVLSGLHLGVVAATSESRRTRIQASQSQTPSNFPQNRQTIAPISLPPLAVRCYSSYP